MTQRHRAPKASGFTLLELLAVAGVLSVLLGIGVGYLGRTSGAAEARAALAAQLRSAALHARSRALPTEVLLEPGVDNGPATVRARGLEPVAIFSFEDGQRFLTTDLQPVLGGVAVRNGRFGAARAPKPGDKQDLLRLPLPPAVADLRDGFAIRLDLRVDLPVDGHGAGIVLRLGRSLEVGVDDDGRLTARVVARSEVGRTGAAANLVSAVPLPLGAWCTIEIGADGHAVWLAIDGRVAARERCRDSIVQQADDVLAIGPGDQPLAATFDEVQLFAYVFSPAVELPPDVEPPAALSVSFDAGGEPIAPPAISWLIRREERTVTMQVGPGGVLQ